MGGERLDEGEVLVRVPNRRNEGYPAATMAGHNGVYSPKVGSSPSDAHAKWHLVSAVDLMGERWLNGGRLLSLEGSFPALLRSDCGGNETTVIPSPTMSDYGHQRRLATVRVRCKWVHQGSGAC